jgi:hypothetical protein
MMTREREKGWVGPHRKWVMGEVYHNDQGDEVNPMGQIPNKGVGRRLGPQKKNVEK